MILPVFLAIAVPLKTYYPATPDQSLYCHALYGKNDNTFSKGLKVSKEIGNFNRQFRV